MPERSMARHSRSNARPDSSQRRASFVVLSLSLWMLVIGGRLVQLQVWQHEALSALAQSQQQRELETRPLRGLILDRQGRELARSVGVDSFFVEPQLIADPHEAARQLAEALGLDRESLTERLAQAKAANKKFMWVARKVEPERAARAAALKLESLHVEREAKRFYPNGSLAAHVLGFVGTDEAGLAGVELFHNAALDGEAGKMWLDRDAKGRAYEGGETEPEAGQSVVLTIDQNVQHAVEQSLASALQRTRAKSATAVVIDPRTGEILALANAPTFDPHKAKSLAPERRVNQALQYIYEPGSTFKLVAFAAALEEKLIKPEDRIDCQMGSITVAKRVIRDHTAFGTLTMTEALAKSSNVAAIKLGLRVGDGRMHDYIRRFGFGAKTGVELSGETAGILRPVARWQKSSIGSIAIGQEIGVTPVQMASAFGAVANDGVRVAPHLVKEVRDADSGHVVRRAESESRRIVGEQTARTLRTMLESVTLKGTAKLAQPDGYSAAGKTGTAQKIDPRTRSYSRTRHVASFVGFAPIQNPSVVIAVVVDEPAGAYHGGDVAAPIFREIAETVLPYLNVTPDVEFKEDGQPYREQLAKGQSATGAAVAGDQSESHHAAAGQQSGEGSSEIATPAEPLQRETRAGGVGEVVYAAASERALLMPDLRG
ncbi:MAG: peptidoglycan D,D-transpeptidase FtsI family protein, partial [Pyrinomonadaceae bacterium]